MGDMKRAQRQLDQRVQAARGRTMYNAIVERPVYSE
jgi:hypothetical protein